MNPWTIPNSAGLPSPLRSFVGAWMRLFPADAEAGVR